MKNKKNRKLKGSVLLTVVSVMALLIIFMAAAVTLANSSNNRAHANYSDSQAEYTAKAAIQSFTRALQDNAAVAQVVVNMSKGDVVTPSVVVTDTGMGNVGYYETVTKNGKTSYEWQPNKIKIEYVKDNMAYDKEQKAWVPMQVIKISATAKVGKQEKSVSYYIERAGTETKNASIKGFQTLGGGGLQNNGEISGALTMGLEQDGTLTYGYNNDYQLRVDTMFINGGFNQTNGNGVTYHVTKPNTQYVVMGDLTVRNGTFTIDLDYPYGKAVGANPPTSDKMTQQTIPYLYVDGNLGTNDGSTVLKVQSRATDPVGSKELKAGAPFNIFAGTIGSTTTNSFAGASASFANANFGKWGGVDLNGADLYLLNPLTGTPYVSDTNFDPTDNSFLSVNSDSNLYKWSSSVLNGTSAQFYSEGGSVYCNHNLHIRKGTSIRGNLVVEGNLYLQGKVDVGGDLVVKGTIDNVANIGTVGGSIYYDGDASTPVFAKENEPQMSLRSDCSKVDYEEASGFELVTVTLGAEDWDHWLDSDKNIVDVSPYTKDNLYNEIRSLVQSGERLLGEGTWDRVQIYVKYKEDDDGNKVQDLAEDVYLIQPFMTPNGVVTTNEYGYYEDSDTERVSPIDEDDAFEPTGFYYAWYDDNQLELVSEDHLYYTENPDSHKGDKPWLDAHKTDKDGSKSAGGNYAVATYPGYKDGHVYPDNALRENITEGGKNKIVMSLTEARNNIGMDSDGNLDSSTYDPGFNSTTVGFKEPENIINADNGYQNPENGGGIRKITVTKNCTITGKIAKSIIEVKPKDNSDVIKIVLKNVVFDQGTSIIVDNVGKVEIMLEGKVELSGADSLGIGLKGAGIYTKKIQEGIKNGGNIRIDENDKMNIIMYGKTGSELTIGNTGMVCAVAKCPYTILHNPQTQSAEGKWEYVSGDNIVPYKVVSWVGSALFKSAETNDNFHLLYTNSAEGGEDLENDEVEGANWYGKYYDAY